MRAIRAAQSELYELEALYLLVRDEIRERCEKEEASGAYDPGLGRLMLLAAAILDRRVQARVALREGHAR